MTDPAIGDDDGGGGSQHENGQWAATQGFEMMRRWLDRVELGDLIEMQRGSSVDGFSVNSRVDKLSHSRQETLFGTCSSLDKARASMIIEMLQRVLVIGFSRLENSLDRQTRIVDRRNADQQTERRAKNYLPVDDLKPGWLILAASLALAQRASSSWHTELAYRATLFPLTNRRLMDPTLTGVFRSVLQVRNRQR